MPAPLNLPLARAALNRNSELRKRETLLEDLLAVVNVVCVLIHQDKALANAQATGLRLLTPRELTQHFEVQPLAYLGHTVADEAGVEAETAVVLLDLSEDQVAALNRAGHSEPGDWLTLRKSGFGLSDRDAGLLTQALALTNWHRGQTFCANCSAATVSTQAGWSRTCIDCKREVFPRNDPAIIVSIVDDEDRILLGSQGAWEENRWSILAGFVDAVAFGAV